MEWLGGTHTPWDTILWFPNAKVLHIADLFGWGLIPCRPTPEKVARLHEVLDRMLQFDAQAVICGHGPVTSIEHMSRFKTYFEELLQKVPPLAAKGLSLDEIEAQIPPPDDMKDWWRFAEWKHHKNLEMIISDYKPSS